MMTSNASRIFRAYDIRGIVGRDFDADWVERLGQACGAYFLSRGHTRAVVGHDCRLTSPEFQRRLVRGLASTGVDVLFLDMVPTPVCYFAIRHLGYQAGVMITASHNPSEYNGFKVWAGRSTIHSGEIQKLAGLMEPDQDALPAGNGVASYHDIVPTYLETLSALVRLDRPVKVVLDGGNGAAGLVARDLLARAGAEVVELFCEPDGRFPNHHPDPVEEKNLVALKATVLKTGAELGIGLDGDGDRIGVVDEAGQVIHGDRLLAVFARQVLKEKPGAAIIGDVKCSHLLFQDIARHGGRPIMSATGHSLIKDRLLSENAALAGEMSGHMFFADRYYGFDDAPYAALRLVEILSRSDRPASRLLEDWPATFVTPELRVDCPEHIKFAVADRARREFAKSYTLEGDDGARLVFPDGWALVRASNTQPALVLRFEAESAQRLAELRRLVEEPLARWIDELGAGHAGA